MMDSCNGESSNNPVNWKYGGLDVLDYTSYIILPSNKADRYKPGVCLKRIAETR